MKTTRKVSVFGGVALSLTGACAVDVDDNDAAAIDFDAAAVIDEGVIVGDLDWVETSRLAAGSVERGAARATAYLSIPQAQARCTGFLVADDVIMTNHHCVSNAAMAVGVRAAFSFEAGSSDFSSTLCDEFIGADQALDFALLRCRANLGATFGTLSLDGRGVARNDAIQLFHQQCDFHSMPACEPNKKMSPGSITGTFSSTRVTHNADMLGGSSGGPIVAAGTTRVVAINNAHVTSNTVNGRGTTNIGVPMDLIVPVLLERFPSIFAASEPTDPVVDDCVALGAAGGVIDEDNACVTLGGDSRWLRSVEDAGHDGDLAWTGTTASASTGNFAQWRVRVPAGRYEVAAHLTSAYGTATTARYRVSHGGVVDTVAIAQAGKNGFVVLGAFDFAGVDGEFVRLEDNTGTRGQQLVFDAIRVQPAQRATCTQVRVTGTESLNVRPQPNTQQSAVGTLAGNEVVRRIETVAGQAVRGNTNWYRVEKPGLAGYISAVYAVCVD